MRSRRLPFRSTGARPRSTEAAASALFVERCPSARCGRSRSTEGNAGGDREHLPPAGRPSSRDRARRRARASALRPQELSQRLAQSLGRPRSGRAGRSATRQRTLRATDRLEPRACSLPRKRGHSPASPCSPAVPPLTPPRPSRAPTSTRSKGSLTSSCYERRAWRERRGALAHARNDCAGTPTSGSLPIEAAAEIYDRHGRYYLALAESAEAAFSTAAEVALASHDSTPRSTTCGPPSTGASSAATRHLGFALARSARPSSGTSASCPAKGSNGSTRALDAAGDAAHHPPIARVPTAPRLKLLEEQGSAPRPGGPDGAGRGRKPSRRSPLSRQAGDPVRDRGRADAPGSSRGRRRAFPSDVGRRSRRKRSIYARRADDERLIAVGADRTRQPRSGRTRARSNSSRRSPPCANRRGAKPGHPLQRRGLQRDQSGYPRARPSVPRARVFARSRA